MGQHTNYPWERFWCPKGGHYSLTDDGFLVDPDDDHGLMIQRSIISEKELGAKSCLALLGEPGIGKTQALKNFKLRRDNELSKTNDDLIYLDLRSYGDENRLYRDIFESPKWTNWLNEAYNLELFLDSLDECMIHIKTVAALLVDEFRRYPVSRLRLRITCRTADWPTILDEELPQIWKQENFAVLELLPLRRADVEAAVRMEGVDVEPFMEAIQQAGMVPFAIRPVTLVMLIQDFRSKGSFSENRIELYDNYCLHLCREQNISRQSAGVQGNLAAEQRLAIAERIAALTMLCKKSTVYMGQHIGGIRAADDLSLQDLTGQTESVGDLSFEVTADAVKETLNTGLFAGAGGTQRFAWSHWSYAEFLAAKYLYRHEIADDKIAGLLFHPQQIGATESFVVPQLQETAAWLAISRPPLFEEILRSDPKVLLNSPVVIADPGQRKALVSSLLHLAEAEEITDMEIGIRRRYELLCHPYLPVQLRPYIVAKTKGFLVRRMAIDIAEVCHTESLVHDLLQVALDRSEAIHNRIQAAHAVGEIGVPETIELLWPLLKDGKIDHEDELKGIALRALWPNHMSTEELFKYVTPPKKESLFGMYAMFLTREIVPQLKADDLPIALDWVRQQSRDFESSSQLRDLVGDILLMSWDNLENGNVLQSFADVTLHRLKNYDSVFVKESSTDSVNLILSDAAKRRLVVKTIVPKFEEHPEYVLLSLVFHSGLLRAEDVPWLIENLKNCGSESRERTWAKLIRHTFAWRQTEITKAILETMQINKALANEVAPLFAPIVIDSQQAQECRKQYGQALRLEANEEKEKASHPPMPEIVDRWLDKFEAGDTDAWWRLVRDLTLEGDSDRYSFRSELNSDLTILPGWKGVDESTREHFVKAAKEYLDRGEPKTDQWLGTNTFHRPATAGYKALVLLLKHEPEYLEALSSYIWVKWTPIILAYPETPSVDTAEYMERIVSLAYSNAPEAFIQTLGILIDKDNQDSGHIFVIQKITKAWDSRLVKAIIDKIKEGAMKPRAVADLLRDPMVLGFSEAQEFAVSLLKSDLKEGSTERLAARHCAALLLMHTGEQGWQIFKPLMENDVPFSREVIAEVAQRDHYVGEIVSKLNEKSVADLYMWTVRQFPHSEDPEEDGAHWVSERENIAMFRDALLRQLREKGTPAAVKAIGYIAYSFPELPWIKYVNIDARQVTLRKTWQGHSPKAILELVRRKECRLVDNGGQLVDVVIDSLTRFQAKLHDETPAVYDLWNDDLTPKEENRISDRIKRHLEQDLKSRGIIVNREVEIRKGQETDIHIDAISSSQDIIKVIIEVKGCWHRDLKTAMKSQLRDRYLRENHCEFGLYLVAWFLCSTWRDDDYRKKATPKWTLDEAARYFEDQAMQLSQLGESLRTLVLDGALR